MSNECIEGLNIKKDGIYVDGTMGGAGHSKEIVKKLSNNGKLIGIDRDIDALNVARERLKDFIPNDLLGRFQSVFPLNYNELQLSQNRRRRMRTYNQC